MNYREYRHFVEILTGIVLGVVLALTTIVATKMVLDVTSRQTSAPGAKVYEPMPKELMPLAASPLGDLCKRIRRRFMNDSTLNMLVDVLVHVESKSNPKAIGDGGRAVGILQMWPIMCREIERITGRRFSLSDRSDEVASRKACKDFLAYHSKHESDPVRLAGHWRNPNGDIPEWYLERIRTALEEKTAVKP